MGRPTPSPEMRCLFMRRFLIKEFLRDYGDFLDRAERFVGAVTFKMIDDRATDRAGEGVGFLEVLSEWIDERLSNKKGGRPFES